MDAEVALVAQELHAQIDLCSKKGAPQLIESREKEKELKTALSSKNYQCAQEKCAAFVNDLRSTMLDKIMLLMGSNVVAHMAAHCAGVKVRSPRRAGVWVCIAARIYAAWDTGHPPPHTHRNAPGAGVLMPGLGQE